MRKTCIPNKSDKQKLYTYPLIIGIPLCIVLGSIWQFYFDLEGQKDGNAVDFWSLVHFITPFVLYLVLFYKTKHSLKSAILTIILGILYEVMEWLLSFSDNPFIYNLAAESTINQITDIIFDILGVLCAVVVSQKMNLSPCMSQLSRFH